MRVAVAGGTGRVGGHIVDVLRKSGHEVVPMSRSTGVDVVSGEGLTQALADADCIVDAATGASPDKAEAAAFFTAAATTMGRAAKDAGVRRAVVVSIVGVDKLTTSYGAAKRDQERVWRESSIPVHILRAELFHEYVGPMTQWSRQGDVAYLPNMRRQPVAARNVAEAVADMATTAQPPPMAEVAGPRLENVVDLAGLWVAHEHEPVFVEGVSNPDDPDSLLYEAGEVLAGPDAAHVGPTFAEWLERPAF